MMKITLTDQDSLTTSIYSTVTQPKYSELVDISICQQMPEDTVSFGVANIT